MKILLSVRMQKADNILTVFLSALGGVLCVSTLLDGSWGWSLFWLVLTIVQLYVALRKAAEFEAAEVAAKKVDDEE